MRRKRSQRLPKSLRMSEAKNLMRCVVHEGLRKSRKQGVKGQHAYDHAVMIGLMLYGGLRASEAISIEIKAIEIEAKRLTVIGKGDIERAIPICESLEMILIAHAEKCGDEGLKTGLFVPTANGKKYSRQALHKALVGYGYKVGLKEKRIHCHMLRHTFAMNVVRAGAGIHTVQRLLGHASIETTQIYLRATATDLQEAVSNADLAMWRQEK